MATKKQIAAVAKAQKAVDKQLAATKALAAKTIPEVGRLTASRTPELTPAEERLFGRYVDDYGQIVPGVRPTKDTDDDTDDDDKGCPLLVLAVILR